MAIRMYPYLFFFKQWIAVDPAAKIVITMMNGIALISISYVEVSMNVKLTLKRTVRSVDRKNVSLSGDASTGFKISVFLIIAVLLWYLHMEDLNDRRIQVTLGLDIKCHFSLIWRQDSYHMLNLAAQKVNGRKKQFAHFLI